MNDIDVKTLGIRYGHLSMVSGDTSSNPMLFEWFVTVLRTGSLSLFAPYCLLGILSTDLEKMHWVFGDLKREIREMVY